uniref:C-type lectin domain-containing protein n=1 Tax=Neogobius melanostomus TaxID=47308 RepID=A0A8C6SIG6_9GOBI
MGRGLILRLFLQFLSEKWTSVYPKVYHLTPDKMSWADALTYCRTHHTDLALIQSTEENRAANNSYGYWIGLIRSTGKWSDNRTVAFTAWSHELSGRKIYHEPFCAAENVHNTWEVFSCQERRPFYCQGNTLYTGTSSALL